MCVQPSLVDRIRATPPCWIVSSANSSRAPTMAASGSASRVLTSGSSQPASHLHVVVQEQQVPAAGSRGAHVAAAGEAQVLRD